MPIVVYRVLWQVVGLRSYVPYVGLAIVLHLVAAALLRVVMRRAGVRPWTATLAASVFVLFGAGAQDILWAFQITFTGALVFGLMHLLLADHDGPIDRRDWLGLGAGLLGLMCSGVAVTMVIVVGIATLLRRSWRVAALHTVPLGVDLRRVVAAVLAREELVPWIGAPDLRLVRHRAPAASSASSARCAGWAGCSRRCSSAGECSPLREPGVGVARGRLVLPVALLIGAAAFLVIAAFDRSGVGSCGRHARAGTCTSSPRSCCRRSRSRSTRSLDRSRVAGRRRDRACCWSGSPATSRTRDDYARHQRLVDDATRQIMLSIGRDPLARKVPRDSAAGTEPGADR